MKVFSLFSGIGGLDLGLGRSGHEIVGQCEIDKDGRVVLATHWPDVHCYPDVTEVKGDQLPTFDVLCGGFPCQDLSVAGNRAGLAGDRSGLFYEFMRLVGETAPAWVLIENVPGLLSSNKGRDMGTVLEVLGDLGYGWAYRVLDAQYFGVAQRRRRVFIVGCAGGRTDRAAQVLFESESGSGDPPPRRQAGTETADCSTVSTLQGGGKRGYRIDAEGVAGGHLLSVPAPRRECGNTQDDQQTGQLVVGFHLTQDPISSPESPPAMSNGNRQGCATLGVAAFSENQRAEVVETDIAHQLSTPGGKPGQGYPAVRDGGMVRRLLPVECERLQGFPDGWTEGRSDSARYRLLGNAVCVPVAEWIGRRLLLADGG